MDKKIASGKEFLVSGDGFYPMKASNIKELLKEKVSETSDIKLKKVV
jgi:hypothetical protein